MSKDMLGGALAKVAGPLKDFTEKLGGSDGERWWTEFKLFLRKEEAWSPITDWEIFYRETFGLDVDFSEVQIPGRKKGVNFLVIVLQGMTSQLLFDKCGELFPTLTVREEVLDGVTSTPDTKTSFARWFRDIVEGSNELIELSAVQIWERDVPCITLEERLLMELKHFRETGRHLDAKNVTLCAGSSSAESRVPCVSWKDGRLELLWVPPSFSTSMFRSRQAFS